MKCIFNNEVRSIDLWMMKEIGEMSKVTSRLIRDSKVECDDQSELLDTKASTVILFSVLRKSRMRLFQGRTE